MAVVSDYKIGNTNIKICDDACRDKTPQEVEAILERLKAIAIKHFRDAEQAAGKA